MQKFLLPKQMKHNLPPFLQENNYVAMLIKNYCRKHLSELSAEFVSEYIHDIVLHNLVKEQSGCTTDDLEKYEKALKDLLKQFCLTKVCPSTVYQWMHHLGFQYVARRKGYHINGHERAATVEYQNAFTDRYLKY